MSISLGNPRRDRLLIIYLCFFVSGLAGLIYQVLWNKYLALFIGSTGPAHVMTLAVFMGGLALGSAVFGVRADRARNPLRLYILLELGIGLFGLAYPFLFEPYRAGFIAFARALGLSASGLMAAKLIFCGLTILIPTFLMGGTLPVLGRYIVNNLAQVGPRVATLYYVNTFGAFFGCLLAGFLMIPEYGLRVSMALAAGLNFAVCILASLLFQEKYRMASTDESWAEETEGKREPALPPTLYPAAMRTAVLVTIGISGFVAMMYEVAFIRLLTLVLGASTYSFSLMVAAFIFGIGLGSFLLSLKKSQGGYDWIYGGAELLLGLSVLAILPLVERVPFWFNQLATVFARAPFSFGPYMFTQLLVCFLLMLLPTVLLGVTLPAATRIFTESASKVGRRVGTVYALNTIGTLLGAGVAGLLLLPALGLRHTFEIGIVANILIGLAILWLIPAKQARTGRAVAATVAVALFAVYLAFGSSWDKNILSSGVYRQKGRFESYAAFLEMLSDRDDIVYYEDGIDASIAVVDIGNTRSLLINGKADASNTGDMTTQMLISHFPLISRPNSKDVLVIGMGSGVSAGSALTHPIEHLDVVEISKEVKEAALEHFAEANLHFAEDPRAEIHIEDAKTFLLLSPRKYDVIVSEPTNPWIAGVAGLFSKEFFETCRDHLAPDGLILQWIHVYEIQDEALMSVLRTFTETFPYVVIWNMNRYDIAIMGSPSPFRPDFAAMEEAIGREAVAKDLTRLGIDHLLALLSLQMFSNAETPTRIFEGATINSDFRPYLEYKAPVGFFAGSPAEAIKSIDMRDWAKSARRLWIDDYAPSPPPTSAEFAANYAGRHESGSLHSDHLRDWADRWYAAWPGDPRAVQARVETRSNLPEWQFDRLTEAVAHHETDEWLADKYAQASVRLLREDRPAGNPFSDEVSSAVQHARSFHPNRQWPYARMMVDIHYRQGDMDSVLREGALVFPHIAGIRDTEGEEAAFELLRMICEAAIVCGRQEIAQRCIDELTLIDPDHLRLKYLQQAVAMMGSPDRESP